LSAPQRGFTRAVEQDGVKLQHPAPAQRLARRLLNETLKLLAHHHHTWRLLGRHAAHRVLVIEDNEDVRETMVQLLQLMGSVVEGADGGVAGVAAAASHRPQLVLIDIGLPDIDGYEVARRLRALPHGDTLRLVAITGYGSAAHRERSAEAGFDEHLTKPVDAEVLRQQLEAVAAEIR
jgi:CheY-like chemotaxis protein